MATWTTAYINDLPDSAFLYVESGEKDAEGKTVPRDKRHFPYRDAGGKVDLPHLRNAISRAPQADLPQGVIDRVMARARRILAAQTGRNSMADSRFLAELTEGPQREGSWIRGVRLLAPGTYNGREYDADYLRTLATNMARAEAADGFRPAYVSGHTDPDQDWEDLVNDEGAVLGHWSNFRLRDEELLADLEVHDTETLEAIEAGRRRYVSAELFHEHTWRDGEVGPFMPIVAGVAAPANIRASLLALGDNADEFPDLAKDLGVIVEDPEPDPDAGGGDEVSDDTRWADLCARFGLEEEAGVEEVLTAVAEQAADSAGEEEDEDQVEPETEREAELRQRLERAEDRLTQRDRRDREQLAEGLLDHLVMEGYLAPVVREALTPVAHLLVRDEELARSNLAQGEEEPVTPLEALVSALRRGPQMRLRVESTLAGDQEQQAFAEGIERAVEAAGVTSDE